MASEQTPALSRRFLTPRISSSARHSTQSTTEQQSPAPSATPFPRTLRFVTPAKQQKEDINANFEYEPSSLSNSRLKTFTARGVWGTDDAIDDVDMDADVELVDAGLLNHDQDTDFIDDTGRVYDTPAAEFNTPHPRKKRRKLSTSVKQAHDHEPVVISSSPSPSQPISDGSDVGDGDDDNDGGNNSSSDLDLGLDPDSPSRKPAIARHGSRFKMAPPSLATALLLDKTESKPVFRQPDPKLPVAAEMTAILPDAFTPSRKKNRKDYLPDGLADTIRNSVLGIATEISHNNDSSSSSSHRRLEGKLLSVKSAHVDASGRAIIATAHDDVQWILPALHNRSRGEVEEISHQVQKIRMFGGILLFSSASYWALPNIQTDSGGVVHFASHWDLPAG